jgi:hypothetical protein
MEPDDPKSSTEDVQQSSPSPDQDRWAEKRAPENRADRRLSVDAAAWLQSLPTDVIPYNLAKRFPRICNRIAERWNYPDLMVPYFDELLLDRRGGRQGFPMVIASEIAALSVHYQATAASIKGNVWDHRNF